MTKHDLRKQFLAERKALPAEEAERRSVAIGDLLYTQLNNPRYIHTFLPILRQNEVNTWPIIHRIWREFPQHKIAVSVTDPVSQCLTHYELTPKTQLIENQWGIPEPVTVRRFGSEPLAVSSSVMEPQQFDVVLVPLLAFDERGHRVGYGGGYYDRFMAECRPDCLKIGLSLFVPVTQIDDIEETDVPLDGCITPERIVWF
ncbi:MAG: 5-formyltetrahydrofolate cyclo-ligase [Rudanella sp.]|nr:5-formyltetrahydrofolate cyclo-ligase [Rudanella sp.]